jgi:hypothetical protein
METEQAEHFYTPPFLTVLCALSAMSFIMAIIYWLWRARHNDARDLHGFGQTIWRFQIYSALAVTFIFLINNIYESLRTSFTQGITFGPELIVFGGAGMLFAFHCHREGAPIFVSILQEVKKIIFLVLACLAGWILTLATGWVLGMTLYGLYTVVGGNTGDIGFIVPLLTGFLWIVPFYVLYRCVPEEKPKFYDLLWPLVFAYLMVLVPLQIQYTANSSEWQDIKTAKPPLKSA